MYRSAMSTRLSRGRSTPAIRATLSPPRTPLPLPLLVAGVRADHHDPPVTADRLALLAHLLDRRSDLHRRSSSLAVPVDDPPPLQIVRRELHQHPISREDPDVIHPHLPRDVGQYLVPVVELHPEHGVGQRLDDRSLNLDRILLRQASSNWSRHAETPQVH